MLSRIFLIFPLILLIGETFGAREPCRPQWTEFHNGCYVFGQDALTWEEAVNECRRHRAELVDIKSKEENNFVGGMSSVDISDFWIGVKSIHCKDNHWWLTTGEAAKYTGWEPQQPNTDSGDESCVRLNPVTMFNDMPVNGWKNLNCNERLPYACKYYRDPCQEGFSYFNGSCYIVEKKEMTWDNARLNCQKKNSVLVDINSEDESQFVADLAKDAGRSIYIGFTDACKEGTWLRVDGTKANFLNWNKGQPDNADNNENCATLLTNRKGQLNDLKCTSTLSSVCKYSLVNEDPPQEEE